MVVTRYLNSTISLLIVLLMLVNSLPYHVKAGNELTQKNWVDASFNMTFVNATYLKVHITLDAYRLWIYYYGSCNASKIREIYGQEGAAFRQTLYTSVSKIMDSTFPNCKKDLGRPWASATSLSLSNINPYNPPVTFYMDCNVSLNHVFFNSVDMTHFNDFVEGMLDIGATIRYNISLYADIGWNITYNLILPNNMSIVEVKGGSVSNYNTITWKIENWNGDNEKLEKYYIKLKKENPTSDVKKEDTQLGLEFDMREIDSTNFNGTIYIKSVNASSITSLPAFVSGVSFIPSDGVRLLVMENITSWDKIYSNLFYPLRDNIESTIRSDIDRNISPIFSVDSSTTRNCTSPYDKSHMDKNPPLTATISSKIDLHLFNISSRAFLGFLYSGGIAHITSNDVPLNGLKYPFSAKIILPFNKTISWNNNSSLNTNLSYNNTPIYKDEKIERDIDIEIKRMDLDFTDFLTGRSRVDVVTDTEEKTKLYHISAFGVFTIPDEINISYINSDLIRLCIDEGIFGEKDVNTYIDMEKNISKQHLSQIFDISNIDIFTDRKLFDKSLTWDKNIKEMDDNDPIVIPTCAHISYSAPFNFSIFPFRFDIYNRSIRCIGIPGQKVTYRITFPKDIDVIFNDSLGTAHFNKTVDGKTVIEIVFDGSEGNAESILNYSLRASPLFVVFIFQPCITGTLVVIILVALIIFFRRKRGVPADRENIEYGTRNGKSKK